MDEHDATIDYDPSEPLSRLEQKFAELWRNGKQARIEEFLPQVDEHSRALLVERLVALELRFRQAAGEEFSSDDYHRRFSSFGNG